MMYNTFTTGLVATLLAGAQIASAHIEMSFPPPFRSKFNPNADPGSIDYSMTAPLKDTGADYPCKGYHVDFGTASGKSTATFVPGQTYNMTTAGTATHGGGSCQLSLSYDKGASFTVIESYIGNCPLAGKYDFTIPADTQPGEAIFAWTWHNRIGNREMYMNCAAVTIASPNNKRGAVSAAFSTRPQIFVANIGNGCKTDENFDVQYPQPGPNVVEASGAPVKGPEGSCGASAPAGNAGSGSGSGSGSSVSSVAAAPVTTSAPAQTSAAAGGNPGGVFITVPSDGPNQGGIFLPSATDIVNAPSSSAAAVVSSSASVSAPAVATSAPAVAITTQAPVQTTLQSITKPSTTVVVSAPAPIATGTTPGNGTGNGSGSGSTVGAYAVGAACTSEGAWNCVGGSSFQRCASGTWSAVMQMAAGTSCSAGESAQLKMIAKKHLTGNGPKLGRYQRRRSHAHLSN
ncbi:hypothetical protein QBC32DRAFT_364921 [Pseudoneurospora amorphoporcata]|uniref:Lytic polysaccharide monooxygenase n=1 Tax=Pseudoneurospora amorphoporcata TaxID=241081 RepID=A0AAN6NRM7_9PEZI|nr:hypothetical protein QBC32DRAFT_364921 [Pseudoneurospora amorphoporcata]